MKVRRTSGIATIPIPFPFSIQPIPKVVIRMKPVNERNPKIFISRIVHSVADRIEFDKKF